MPARTQGPAARPARQKNGSNPAAGRIGEPVVQGRRPAPTLCAAGLELRVCIDSRIDPITCAALAEAIAQALRPDRRTGRSTIHIWAKRLHAWPRQPPGKSRTDTSQAADLGPGPVSDLVADDRKGRGVARPRARAVRGAGR